MHSSGHVAPANRGRQRSASCDKLQSVNGGWTTIIISATAGFTTQLSGTVSGSGGGTTAGTGG